MAWLKKSWFPAVGVVLLATIAFNVWQIASIRSSTPSAENEAATAGTPNDRADGQDQKAVSDLTPSPAPHEIVIRLAATNGEAEFDGDRLTDSMKMVNSVEEAVFEGKTMKVTLTGPANLSELLGRLSLQQVAVVEDEFQLHGALRLHASGMT